MNVAVYHATVRRLGYEPVGAATCPCPSCQGARHPAPPAPALPELAPDLARVLGLPLDQLDRVLTVRVPWLDVPLWFVPDERDAEALVASGEATRGTVWTRRELRDLWSARVTKAGARRVAEAKRALDGEVTAVRPRVAHARGDSRLRFVRASPSPNRRAGYSHPLRPKPDAESRVNDTPTR